MADTVFENPYVKGLLYGVVHSNISKTLNKSSEDQIASKIKNCISSVISNNDLKIESSDIKVDKVDDGYQVLLDSSKLFMIFKNDESWLLKTRQLIRWRQSLNSKVANRVCDVKSNRLVYKKKTYFKTTFEFHTYKNLHLNMVNESTLKVSLISFYQI